MLYPPKYGIANGNGVVIGYISSMTSKDADGNNITIPTGNTNDALNKCQVPRELQVFEQWICRLEHAVLEAQERNMVELERDDHVISI